MSYTASREAWKAVRGSKILPSARLVLLALADRHNQETGRCDPSLSRICEDTGLSERTVRSALRQLEKAKLIRTIHRTIRTGVGKRNLNNRYVLLGGATVAGGMGQQLPPNQEYRTSSFEDVVNLLDDGE